MVTLTPGQPVTTIKPVILVENELPAGQYRFQLVVTDEAGLESAPAELLVVVRGPIRPREPIVDGDGPVITRPGVGRPTVLRPGVLRPIRRPP